MISLPRIPPPPHFSLPSRIVVQEAGPVMPEVMDPGHLRGHHRAQEGQHHPTAAPRPLEPSTSPSRRHHPALPPSAQVQGCHRIDSCHRPDCLDAVSPSAPPLPHRSATSEEEGKPPIDFMTLDALIAVFVLFYHSSVLSHVITT